MKKRCFLYRGLRGLSFVCLSKALDPCVNVGRHCGEIPGCWPGLHGVSIVSRLTAKETKSYIFINYGAPLARRPHSRSVPGARQSRLGSSNARMPIQSIGRTHPSRAKRIRDISSFIVTRLRLLLYSCHIDSCLGLVCHPLGLIKPRGLARSKVPPVSPLTRMQDLPLQERQLLNHGASTNNAL